jgi:hypothetical protein
MAESGILHPGYKPLPTPPAQQCNPDHGAIVPLKLNNVSEETKQRLVLACDLIQNLLDCDLIDGNEMLERNQKKTMFLRSAEMRIGMDKEEDALLSEIRNLILEQKLNQDGKMDACWK